MPTEILGASEIVGDEYLGDEEMGEEMVGEEMVGARRGGRHGGRRGNQHVAHHEATRARDLVLGFDSVAMVASLATQNVTSQPQLMFRPDRLVIPATIAPSFLITDLKVGKNSQFLNNGNVPAECFTQAAFGVRLKMDTAQISNNISIGVTNISAGALRFVAALIGPSME